MHRSNKTILVTNVASASVTLMDGDSLLNSAEGVKKISLPVGKMPHEVITTPNGKFALVSNYGEIDGIIGGAEPKLSDQGETLTSINIETGEVIETIQLPQHSRPHGITFVSDTRAVVTAEGIQSLLIVDFDDTFMNGKVVNIIELPCKGSHMVTLTNDKQTAYVGCFSGFVCKVNLTDPLARNPDVQPLKVGNSAECVALTLDENMLLVTSRKDNYVIAVNTKDMTIHKMTKTATGPTRVSITDDGQSALVIASQGGKVQKLDLNTFQIANTFASTNSTSCSHGRFFGGFCGALPVPVNSVQIGDDTMLIANTFGGKIARLNLKDGEILATYEAESEPDGLSISSQKCNRF